MKLNTILYKYAAGTLLAVFALGASHNPHDIDPYLYKVSITESKPASSSKNSRPSVVKNRTGSFFAMLHPHILKTNKSIWKDRSNLVRLKGLHDSGRKLSKSDHAWLRSLASRYKIKSFDAQKPTHWDALVDRVDIVPASLALAQAATESGFGESRMAKLGNNLFGHSCFSVGCGIAPRGQKEGTPYELSKFSSVKDSVESYVKNINTHRAYRHIRAERKKMRVSMLELSGPRLALGLKSYSERGEAYISDIKTMIRVNQLERFGSL